MQDRQLYAQILGIAEPWGVESVELRLAEGEVIVGVAWSVGSALVCPRCGKSCPGYDSQPRRWRHLDTCQYQTILTADVPRCQCPEHGVQQIAVPWAEKNSRFTLLFERLAIDWMKEAGRSAVARRMGMSWAETHGIMQRAVRRGLARRQQTAAPLLGVDEKSFQGRKFVTVVCDLAKGHVLHVADDRSKESLDSYYRSLTPAQTAAIEAVAMDMHDPYVASTAEHVPDGKAKIVFDKFHIVKQLSEAVDQVRRQEHRELSALGSSPLTGSKYGWLRNPTRETRQQAQAMKPLRTSKLRTARAWALRETIMNLWDYRRHTPARRFFAWWHGWAVRSRLTPMKKAAAMLKRRLDNVLRYLTYPITNAMSESLNSKIQWIKYTARGFRSREGFKTAIYFHCGGLDLYPH